MILAGTDGPIVTPIKALLTPQKMQDLRVKVSIYQSNSKLIFRKEISVVKRYIIPNSEHIVTQNKYSKQNQYDHHKQLRAAQGVKIEAKELEKCIAGLNLLVANHPDEVEICKEEIEERLSTVMSSFKTKDRGVFVQASTLGSLEALLAFLKDSKIPVSTVYTNDN